MSSDSNDSSTKRTIDDSILLKILLPIVEFLIAFLRNLFLIKSAVFLILPIMLIIIFYQETLNLNPISFFSRYMILLTHNQRYNLDLESLESILFKISFYLSIVSEGIRYIKVYFLKIKEKVNLKKKFKHILFILFLVTFIFIVSFFYLKISFTQQVGLSVLFFVFSIWFVCVKFIVLYHIMDMILIYIRKFEKRA